MTIHNNIAIHKMVFAGHAFDSLHPSGQQSAPWTVGRGAHACVHAHCVAQPLACLHACCVHAPAYKLIGEHQEAVVQCNAA